MDQQMCASELSRLHLLAGACLAFALVVVLGYTIAFFWSHKRRDVSEAELKRELEFRREQARFEGLDKRLTTVWRQ